MIALALLAGLPALSALVRDSRPLPRLTQETPAAPAPWVARAPDTQSLWVPVFAGADAQTRAVFAGAGGEAVELYRARYVEQRQGAELVGDTSSLFGST